MPTGQGKPRLLLAIPCVVQTLDSVELAHGRNGNQPGCPELLPESESRNELPREATGRIKTAPKSSELPRNGDRRIRLSPPESSWIQEGVRCLKSRTVSLASGKLAWRFFLGSGVAIFIGAVTLMVLGPSAKRIDVTTQQGSPEIPASGTSSESPSPPGRPASEIELTVTTSEGAGGQVPAEFVDPFVPENQVQPKYVHAVHSRDLNSPAESSQIHTVSQSRSVIETQSASQVRRPTSRPVHLTGTIEATEDVTITPSSKPPRNYERSRPRDR